MSSTWRQSADHPRADEYQAKDPAENLLWRARVRRLTAEQIRDAMLSASGELQTAVGGPSVDAKVPRRALYVKCFRNTPDPFLQAFDVADGLKSVSQRNTTTTPTQSLLMINGDYPLQRSRKLAERLLARNSSTLADTLSYAIQMTWGREPTAAELASAEQFFGARSGEEGQAIDLETLVDFCHVLFNSNEFLYVD